MDIKGVEYWEVIGGINNERQIEESLITYDIKQALYLTWGMYSFVLLVNYLH